MFECRHRPIRLADEVAAQVLAAYAEPHRAYHNAAHIQDVLRWFDTVYEEVGWSRPAEVYIASVFHDAIYVPGAKDNETRSAAWARDAGRKGLRELVGERQISIDLDRVAQLIELTAQHGGLEVVDAEAALFLDCDMSILGAAPEKFDAYDRAIAIEYQALPRDAYAAGRRAFLDKLLAKPRIFLSDYFHAKLDAQARANLSRALSSSPS